MKPVKDDIGFDGSIIFVAFGCRQTSILQGIIGDDLRNLGLSILTLDGDVTDPRISSLEQRKILLKNS